MTIVIQKSSGGVAVMRLIGEADAAVTIEQWKAVNPGEYVAHAEVADDALPQDRTTRAQWALVNGAVVIDPSLVPIPRRVTRRQARQALLIAGLLASVQPAIDAITDATERGMMQIWWDDSLDFDRSNSALITMATSLGLDSAAIDSLFVTAATL